MLVDLARRTAAGLVTAAVAATALVAAPPALGAAADPVPRLLDVPASQRLVPAPASLRELPGAAFRLTPRTQVVVPGRAGTLRVAQALAGQLRRATGLALPVVRRTGVPDGAVVLRLRAARDLPGAEGPEGYRLDVSAQRVLLEATTPEGLSRGVQTLRQLLPPQAESSTVRPGPWTIAPVRVIDAPRFAYRGAMLDVARHFLTVEEVKRYVDEIALYKVNHLHLHLTDDQGWRLDIQGWPRLTRYGGTTEVGGTPGGWYSQDDYREIVQYAAERFVTVVPEIDLPGHTNAALASYARLTCDGVAPPLYTGIEVGFSSLCIRKELTYAFLDDVIGQVADLTPGPYLHIGGDEALSTSDEDYRYFVERVDRIVRSHGKRTMGWAEISAADVAPGGVSQYWNPAAGSEAGTRTATESVARGLDLVMSPASRAYIDQKYDPSTPLGLAWAGPTSVPQSYDWDPVTFVDGVRERDVLGVEAPMWTETLENIDQVEYMAFPRLPGIAEKGWSRAGGTWEEYRVRLAAQSPRWEVLGIDAYCAPEVDWRLCRGGVPD